MKILVTGGAGFVGSHLCTELLNQDHQVFCVDNLYTGREQNIEHLKSNKNFRFINFDISNPMAYNLLTEEYHVDKYDQIYHLASPASPPAYMKDPLYTIKTNFLGTQNALDIANLHKSTILLASTSEVYGDPSVHPQPETYWGNVNPIGPRSCYDEGKRIAETLTMEYGNKFGINYKIIRIFNTYGPHMDPKDGRVVSNFITQALKDEDITIYGDGKQTRSFQYVSDLVAGMMKLMNSPDNVTGPVNIGNPGEFTMIELAEKILEKLSDSKSKLVFRELPKNDPMQRKPEIRKAKELLDWEPKINLDKGLELTIPYFAKSI